MPRDQKAPPVIDVSSRLTSDCSRCFGLCCVALPFTKSVDFPVDKPAGQPCAHLRDDFRCATHSQLRDRGYRGCTVFECFGAGQQVSQVTFGGRDWRDAPETAPRMFQVFAVMRQLHEVLRHLTEALGWPAARPVWRDLHALLAEVQRLTAGNAQDLLRLNVAAVRAQAGPLLARASELVRAGVPGRAVNRQHADLIGADLRGADLRGASLRGTYLIRADLRGADLRGADLLGTDLRDADLRGADLRGSLFLTEVQVNASKGDMGTRLPTAFTRPAHWHPAR